MESVNVQNKPEINGVELFPSMATGSPGHPEPTNSSIPTLPNLVSLPHLQQPKKNLGW